MVKAKGGPIAADGLYGQWQSPFPTLPAARYRHPSIHCSTTNTITLSESKRNSSFDDVAYLSKIELPATDSHSFRFCPSIPARHPSARLFFSHSMSFSFIREQFRQRCKLQVRNCKFRRISRLFLSLAPLFVALSAPSQLRGQSIVVSSIRKGTLLREAFCEKLFTVRSASSCALF